MPKRSNAIVLLLLPLRAAFAFGFGSINLPSDKAHESAQDAHGAEDEQSPAPKKDHAAEEYLPMGRFIEPDKPLKTDEKSAGFDQGSSMGISKLLENMRYAVVRIQSVEASVDWFKPWEPFGEDQGVGTGFVVDTNEDGSGNDFVVVTNAHVVSNALTVQIQLPALGRQTFDASVPLICTEFDVAVVRLKDPHKLTSALTDQNRTLRSLSLRKMPIEVGTEVAAFGFPLGSSSPKLSRGVIAGVEQVDGSVVLQTTTPISPGNSGGPLLAYNSAKKLEVVGVNFASSSAKESQNNNYVVPAFRIAQVLREFRSRRASKEISFLEKPGHTHHLSSHVQLRLAPIGVLTVESNDALYNASNGCEHGVFISNIQERSVLLNADPPVPKHSFLTKVGNSTLDAFGMGHTAHFPGEPIPFEGLLTLGDSPFDAVNLTVCKSGKVTNHVVSMKWKDSYRPGIDLIEETLHAPKSLEFEVFAGVTFMQMTMNHVENLLTNQGALTLGRWLLPEAQTKPRLIVTHVNPGSYASHVLNPGMVISSVNGKNVSTLEEYRNMFTPKDDVWKFVSDRGIVFAVDFRKELVDQIEDSMTTPTSRYLMTSAVMKAAKKLHIMKEAHTEKQKPSKPSLRKANASAKAAHSKTDKVSKAPENKVLEKKQQSSLSSLKPAHKHDEPSAEPSAEPSVDKTSLAEAEEAAAAAKAAAQVAMAAAEKVEASAKEKKVAETKRRSVTGLLSLGSSLRNLVM